MYAILQSMDFYLRKKKPLVELFLMVVVEQRNTCKNKDTHLYSHLLLVMECRLTLPGCMPSCDDHTMH